MAETEDDEMPSGPTRGKLTRPQGSILTRWNNRVKQFYKVFERLEGHSRFVATQPLSLQREYAQVMAKGMGIKTKIAFVQNAINKATGAFTTVKDWFVDTFAPGLNGIIIPIAIISSALAVMIAFIKTAEIMDKRINAIKYLENKGHSKEAAKQKVDASMWPTNGVFSMFGFNLKPLIPAAVGIGIFILLRSRK